MTGSTLNAKITKTTEVAPGLAIIQVTPVGWELPDFTPGQYGVLGLPGSAPRAELSDPDEKPPAPDKIIKRAYSIASSSKEKEYLEFYVTMVRSGALTPRLFALEEGDSVFMGEKFKGVFTLKDTPDDSNLILVSTGTGLAPYMSMARTQFTHCSGRHFAILHGARHSWDLGYRSELETLARNCDNFAYAPSISRPDEEPEGWAGYTGYVQDLWKAGVVEQKWGFTPNPDNTHIFLCGAPGMIEAMVEILNGEGYKEHKKRDPGQTHVERFW